jgi:hypothetical protein
LIRSGCGHGTGSRATTDFPLLHVDELQHNGGRRDCGFNEKVTMNRFSPPTAIVEDVNTAQSQDAAPPLWNPNAAANWSLLFSPAFGAWLHMKNWQALGDTKRAASARVWMWVSIACIVLFTIADISNSGAGSGGGPIFLILLLAWYFASGRGQAKFVKERFGKDYPRKGWGRPFAGVFIAFCVLFAVAVVLLLLMER